MTQRVMGVKLSHDGGVCCIEDGELKFHFEAEKLEDGKRYTLMDGRMAFEQILKQEGMELDNFSSISVDGFNNGMVKNTLTHWDVAPYHEYDLAYYTPIGKRFTFPRYSSFTHVYNHIMGSYMISPFAKQNDSCYCLVWDGALAPRLYSKSAFEMDWRLVGTAHEIYGTIYGIMSYYWGPFKRKAVAELPEAPPNEKGGYDKPGKLMGWIGLGAIDKNLFPIFDSAYEWARKTSPYKNDLKLNRDGIQEHRLCRYLYQAFTKGGYEDDATIMRSFHTWLTDMTVNGLIDLGLRAGDRLIITGGCGLNIKLNSELRSAGMNVWVPPTPNDSGSALGAACSEWHHITGESYIDWTVYSGPKLLNKPINGNWVHISKDHADVARVIADGHVVVFLDGRAEIGPRSLGARSLLADPRRSAMKDELNRVKGREDWRPVAPIALEGETEKYWGYSKSDPYMLFDHHATEDAQSYVPAVVHIDGTSRLQTALEDTPCLPVIEAFKEMTGIGVLCNTSANRSGHGFFSSAVEAMEWSEGKDINYVWADGDFFVRGN